MQIKATIGQEARGRTGSGNAEHARHQYSQQVHRNDVDLVHVVHNGRNVD